MTNLLVDYLVYFIVTLIAIGFGWFLGSEYQKDKLKEAKE